MSVFGSMLRLQLPFSATAMQPPCCLSSAALVDAGFGRNDEGLLLGFGQKRLPALLGRGVVELSCGGDLKLEQHEERVALVLVQALEAQLAHLKR